MTDTRPETRAAAPLGVLVPLGLSTALSLTGDASLYTVLPTRPEQAGILLAAVGLILGVNRGVRILSNSLAGAAYDRGRRRRFYVPSVFLGSLSTLLYAVVTGFWPLLLARMLWGIAWSGIWVGGVTIVLDATDIRNRGRWLGFYHIWFLLGIAQGSFLGGLLTDIAGYRVTMVLAAGLTALGGIVALIFLPETGAHQRREQKPARSAPLQPPRVQPDPVDARRAAARGGPGHGPGRRFGSPLWAASALLGVNRFVLAGILSATISLLVADSFRLDPDQLGVATLAGIVIAARTLLSMASAPLVGALRDAAHSTRRIVLFVVGTGFLGMVLIAPGHPALLLAGIAVASVANGGLPVLARSMVGDGPPAPKGSGGGAGRRIGLLHTAGDVGSAAGPPFAYLVLAVSSLSVLYCVAAALYLALLLVLLAAGRAPSSRH